MSIPFKCPYCGEIRESVDEVIKGITSFQEAFVYDEEVTYPYDDDIYYNLIDAQSPYYICRGCEHILYDDNDQRVRSNAELIEFVKHHRADDRKKEITLPAIEIIPTLKSLIS